VWFSESNPYKLSDKRLSIFWIQITSDIASDLQTCESECHFRLTTLKGVVFRIRSIQVFQLVDERNVGRKPKSLSFEGAGAMPLTTITAWGALYDKTYDMVEENHLLKTVANLIDNKRNCLLQ